MGKRYLCVFLSLLLLAGCGGKEAKTAENEAAGLQADDGKNGEPVPTQADALPETEQDEEKNGEPVPTQADALPETGQDEEETDRHDGDFYRELAENEDFIMFYAGYNGTIYYGKGPEEIYIQNWESYARVDGSGSTPYAASKSDRTFLFRSLYDETAEGAVWSYDVYFGEELLAENLFLDVKEVEDLYYREEEREIVLLTYYKDMGKREEGYRVITVSLDERQVIEEKSYVLTEGEVFDENKNLYLYGVPWLSLLTEDAVYMGSFPDMYRLELADGSLGQWGVPREELTERLGLELGGDMIPLAAQGDYLLAYAFYGVEEEGHYVYLLYRTDGELVDDKVIP